jgi:hypothetical protein
VNHIRIKQVNGPQPANVCNNRPKNLSTFASVANCSTAVRASLKSSLVMSPWSFECIVLGQSATN